MFFHLEDRERDFENAASDVSRGGRENPRNTKGGEEDEHEGRKSGISNADDENRRTDTVPETPVARRRTKTDVRKRTRNHCARKGTDGRPETKPKRLSRKRTDGRTDTRNVSFQNEPQFNCKVIFFNNHIWFF
jgi:hypothetical protein